MNIVKPKSESGKVIFYIFEICALVVAVLYFILAIYLAAEYQSFLYFVNEIPTIIVNPLIIYGIGRIIDLMCYKADCKKAEKKEDNDKKAE